MNEDFDLERFGRHIPRILEKQLIANLAEQFLNQENLPEDYCGNVRSIPSVSHFHGALLFVDISGFTVLSQRLPVDELRIQINGYFKRILDIVERHGGDVIKFAGDALFVVWQTDVTDIEGSAANVVLRALRCGVDINFECSNYRILLKKKAAGSPHAQHNGTPTNASSSGHEGDSVSNIVLQHRLNTNHHVNGSVVGDEFEVTYLNVHAGLSVGHMTGIDVGALDRWEFFIMGQPLFDVAQAEVDAGKGEIVIAANCHELICPLTNSSAEEPSEDPESPLPNGYVHTGCGCIRTPSGCFRVPDKRVPKMENVYQPDDEDELDRELAFYESVMQHSSSAFAMIKEQAISKFAELRTKGREPVDYHHTLSSRLQHNDDPDSAIKTAEEAALRDEEQVYNYFMRWVSSCLRFDFAQHVHEADRVEFEFKPIKRTDQLEACFADFIQSQRRKSEPVAVSVRSGRNSHASSHSSNSSNGSNSSSHSGSFVSKLRNLTHKVSLRDKTKAKHDRTLQTDNAFHGELRNVIVLFIAVYGDPNFDKNVPEAQRCNLPVKATVNAPRTFNFLVQDGVCDTQKDSVLLGHYQCCVAAILQVLRDKGGQLRQFIVDDKGTVAIGTFGLRGSTNVDNAASAVEAALEIVMALQALNLDAAIGVTSGQAYCGIVGSQKRHEYAVMGPSTNLSARLMGKAKRGEVLCDYQIRVNDRTHQFKQVGSVQAKGFAEPVAIYKPQSIRASQLMDAAQLNEIVAAHRGESSTHNSARSPPSMMRFYSDGGNRLMTDNIEIKGMNLFGRDEEIKNIIKFLFDALIDGDLLEKKKDDEVCTSRFRLDERARSVNIDGNSGIGKTAMLEYLMHFVRGLVRTHRTNIRYFHTTCSSLDVREPFRCWKPIVRQLLATLSRLSGEVESAGVKKEHEKLRQKWLRGAHHIAKHLPERSRKYLSLLSTAHIVPGIEEDPAVSVLSGADKLNKLTDLLLDIVTTFPLITGILSVIFVDDVHVADTYTIRLFMRVMSECKGVVFIISWNIDAERALSDDHKAAMEENEPFFLELKVNNQALEVVLDALSFDAVKTMASDALLDANVINTDDEVYQKLYEISGGNPLYLYELVQALVGRLKENGDTGLRDLVNSFSTQRVEEVIFFRLDRLEAQTQTMLKMAAVAGASGGGSGFSIDLLCSLMKASESEAMPGLAIEELQGVFGDGLNDIEEANRALATRVARLVKQLLDGRDFLKIVHDRHSSSFTSEKHHAASIALQNPIVLLAEIDTGAEKADPVEDLKDKYFEFKIGLERKIIYNLMLEDQRESLHDRVASYLERENAAKQRKGSLSAQDLLEEAFHWEHAKIWSTALTCYFRAAVILEGLGAYKGSYRYYTQAFKMYSQLRSASQLSEDPLESLDNSPAACAIPYMMRLLHDEVASFIDEAEQHDYIRRRRALARMLSGDESLLDTIIRMLTKFGQGALTLGESPEVVKTLYYEALQLAFLTWKLPSIMAMIAATQAARHLQQSQKLESLMSSHITTHSMVSQVSSDDEFGLDNFALIFPIISGLASLFRLKRLPDDENHSLERMCYDAMVQFSDLSPEYKMHMIQARTLLHTVASDKADHAEAARLVELIESTYDYDEVSHKLVDVYGNDRVPYTLALHCQTLMLIGQLPSAYKIMNKLLKLLPRITHLHSMGTLAIPLANCLALLGRFDESREVFEMYCTYEQSKPLDSYSFFREVNPLFRTWHSLRLQVLLCAIDGDQEYIETNEVMDKVIARGFMYSDANARPLVTSALSAFGAGLEFLCADTLGLQALLWARYGNHKEPSDDARKASHRLEALNGAAQLLEVGLEYVELQLNMTRSSFKLSFSYFFALLCKMRLLLQRHELRRISQAHNEDAMQVALQIDSLLKECDQVGVESGMSFLSLSALLLRPVVFEDASESEKEETQKRIAAAVQIEGLKLEEVATLQQALPQFWCGEVNHRLPSPSASSASPKAVVEVAHIL